MALSRYVWVHLRDAPGNYQRTQIVVKRPDRCEHGETICADCFDQWYNDYFIKLNKVSYELLLSHGWKPWEYKVNHPAESVAVEVNTAPAPYLTELEMAFNLCKQDGIQPSDEEDALLYLVQSCLKQIAWATTDGVEMPSLTPEMVVTVLDSARVALESFIT